ncbi:MAG: NAD(P)/FAD-dependent oxidoreductase [Desulfobacterales bacterium]|nr:NAD(P)/FAD-dependent oxidoreductase [Desulfobacterales bacterium]MBF0395532.1 NAD(P)/FAD-dependent oxidoreductase [Desulfobacterales bacterium]
MVVGTRYQKEKLNTPYDIIIIGSGIGGLCTASLLSKAKKKVLVLERHYTAGGFTHTFKRKNYEWDIGVHYIGEVHDPLSPVGFLFNLITEGNLKWAKMPDVYDRFYFGNDIYEFTSGRKNLMKRLISYFPDEEKDIKNYFTLLDKIYFASMLYFTEKSFPPSISQLLYSIMSSPFFKYSDKTVKEGMAEITSNPKLLGLLTGQWGDYGLPPSQASLAIHGMVARHFFEGGNYPVGGSASIARSLIPVIEKSGGNVFTQADVQEIIIKDNKAIGVRLTSGDEIYANIVISGIGVFNTFKKLIPEEIANKHGLLQKLKEVNRSHPHICLYVGIKESAKKLGLGPTNLWVYPNYDHDKNVQNYLNDPKAPFPSLYISFPSSKDPEWEKDYPDRSTIEVITFTPYESVKQWENTKWRKRGPDYEKFKESLSNRMLEELYKYVPQVKGKVDYHELSTALSTKHFCAYEQGEIYGIDHSPSRFRKKWLRPHTPIKNLFLTGQDAAAAGIAGAMSGGFSAACAILGPAIIKVLSHNFIK